MDIVIEIASESIPYDLLLLADPSEQNIKTYVDRGITVIAKYKEEIVGALVMIETRLKTVEIMNVSVKEEYQNKGIGKKLILFSVDYIKNNMDIKAIEIGTGNPGAIQMLLYQKCGFRIVGIDFDYFRKYCDHKIIENGIECRDMIRMRMEL